MKKLITWVILILGMFLEESLYAASLPYTDIKPTDPYYSSVDSLYKNYILYDDGSHLFRPDDTIARGDFVWLSVSVSCKRCITPTSEDIALYTISPFVDLAKTHPAFYCIAYAADKRIVQWYTLDNTGNVSCQDGTKFQSAPFCENNKTSRIEAAAMLLRQANLWSEELNKNLNKTLTINDVSDYWYGYAVKGIEAWILTLKPNNTLSPDEAITRWEFVIMAAKMFDYNQCAKAGIENTEASAIAIVGESGNKINRSVFTVDEKFSLIPVTTGDNSNYRYEWTAIDRATNRVVTGTDPSLLSSLLGAGNWSIELDIIDKSTNRGVSSPSTTIVITDGKPLSGSAEPPIGNGGKENTNSSIDGKIYPSITLTANKLTVWVNENIDFSSYGLWKWPLNYMWDFGDSNRISSILESNNTEGIMKKVHAYDAPWIYTVSVTLIDKDGQTVQTKIIIEVTGSNDTDGDGVNDENDLCPSIVWSPSNNGCPSLDTNNYTKWLEPGINTNPIIPPYSGNTGNPNQNNNNNVLIGSAITVVGSDGKIIPGSTFNKDQSFNLTPITSEPGDYGYTWKAVDSVTGKTVTGNGGTLPSSSLWVGNWNVDLTITDKTTGTVVSRPSTTISISDGSTLTGNPPVGGNGNGTGGGTNTTGIWGTLVPSVTIGANTLSVGAGGSIDFTSSALWVWPLSYTWNFWDGSPTSVWGTSPSHTFSTPGTYTVTVYVTDANGKTAESSMLVKIDSSTSSVGSAITVVGSDGKIIPGSTFNKDQSFNLTPITSEPGDYGYTWKAVDSVTGKTVTGNGGTLPSSSLWVGNWNVDLTITDKTTGTVVSRPSTTISISDGSTLTGNPPVGGNGNGTGGGTNTTGIWGTLVPSVTIGANTLSVGAGGSIDFTSSALWVWPLSYTWNFWDGSPTSVWGTSPSHTFSTPGTYTVTVYVTDANGKTAESSMLVKIDSSTSSVGSAITVVGSDGKIIPGSTFNKDQSFNLTPITSEPGDYGYTWKAVDSVTGKTVTGNGGTLPSSSLWVGNWNVDLTITDKTTGTVVSRPSTTISISDGSTLTGNPPVGGNGNGTGGGTNTTGIWGTLVPSVTIGANTLSVGAGGSIDFTSSALWVWPLSYTWNFWDGSPTSVWGTSPSHTFSTPGTYTVTVYVTDANGKTAESSMLVKIDSSTSSVGSAITVVGSDGKIIPGSTFNKDQSFNLTPITSEPGDYGYTWKAVDSVTGKTVTGNGGTLPSSSLWVGNWNVDLTITDKTTGTVVSRPSTTISISDGSTLTGNPPVGGNGNGTGGGTNTTGIWGTLVPSVTIGANTLSVGAGGSIDFTSSALWVWPLSYTWNFWDGSPTSVWGTSPSHTFSTPGTYTVTVYVTDANGKTAESTLSVNIKVKDTDGDGVPDSSDSCPTIQWWSGGCPIITGILWRLENNACILQKAKTQWVIIATPVCDQCPCANKISFGSSIRACDVLFPAILAPDLATVYSRWWLYQLP
jgi:PKD repeat protein